MAAGRGGEPVLLPWRVAEKLDVSAGCRVLPQGIRLWKSDGQDDAPREVLGGKWRVWRETEDIRSLAEG